MTSWPTCSSTASNRPGSSGRQDSTSGRTGFLAEAVPDETGDVGVERLVVGDAVAEGVGGSDRARLRGARGARAADHRVGPEAQRIGEVVVETPVHDVDRHLDARGPRPGPVAAADRIVPLHELQGHESCRQGVFEVRGVAGTGREDNDARVADPVGRGGAQSGKRLLRIPVQT
jgi:hypothetical protein